MYRSVSDVSRATRPALKRYEWMLTGMEIAWPEYKETTNVQEWGCLIQEELPGSLNNTREGSDNKIRELLLDFRDARMGGNRADPARTANQLRKKLQGEMRYKKSRIDQEIDTD